MPPHIANPLRLLNQRTLWIFTALVGALILERIAAVLIGGLSGGTDLTAYVAAAERLRAGQPIYWLPIDTGGNPPSYLYPPLLGLVFTLLGGYQSAWLTWGLLSLLSWGASLVLIIRELAPELGERLGPLGWPLLVAALLAFPPLLAHMIWGQVGLPILLCLTGAWLCLRRGREGWAGVLLGVAIAIKLYPALIIFPLLTGGRWRTTLAACAVAAALIGGSFLAVEPAQAIFYVRELLPATNGLGSGRAGNYALRELLPRFLGPAPSLAIVAVVAWLGRRSPPGDAVALGATAALLVSPVVWGHYYVLALLPWLIALARARGRELVLLIAAFALIATASLVFYVPLALVPLAHKTPILGGLLLFAVQVWQARRREAAPEARPALPAS